ncbi:MAG: hypothetical protein ACI9G1_000457 [Pirellulaceae bacterium]|jgi:hypothetical protein
MPKEVNHLLNEGRHFGGVLAFAASNRHSSTLSGRFLLADGKNGMQVGATAWPRTALARKKTAAWNRRFLLNCFGDKS